MVHSDINLMSIAIHILSKSDPKSIDMQLSTKPKILKIS